jgi:lysyl-tRNA synthetase class 2
MFLATHSADFTAPANPTSTRRAVIAALAGVSVAITAGVVGVELHSPRLPIPTALHAVSFRLVGYRDTRLPEGLDDWMSPALLAVGIGVALFVLWLAFRPAVAARASSFRPMSRERARFLVERYGTDSLSYFALRSDKEWFGYRDTVVAYRVHNGIALVSPDPIGPVAQRADAWAAFREFADDHGWSVAVMAASAEWLPVYSASGMHNLYIGDEAVVDVQRFRLDGKTNKSLRQSVARVRKAGYRVEMLDPACIEPDLGEQLRELMTESRRGEVERGFSMTLGRAFQPDDRGLLLAVAFAPDGSPAAFCQYVPARGISGWSLDLMRRSERADHPNGLTELVVVDTIEHLRDRGDVGLALNFATFRAVLAREAGDRLVHRVEKWFLERMSDSMQIESLWTFNQKFQPEWHPRYACYDAPEHLLPASIAVARAESFWELPVLGRFFGSRPGDDAVPAPPDVSVR